MDDYLEVAKERMEVLLRAKAVQAELYAPGVIAATLLDIAETLRRIEEALQTE